MFVPFISKRLKNTKLSRRAGGGGSSSSGGGSSSGGSKGGGGGGSSGGGSSGGGKTGGSVSGGGSSGGGSSGWGSSGGGKTGGNSGGGGGVGKTGGGSVSGGGKGGGSSGGSTGGPTGSGSSGRSSPISSGGTTQSAKPFGSGGGTPKSIPSGQLFAGRISGGATRTNVYGNKQYGSGYPGISGRGVGGRGFPFVFWPVAWAGIGVGSAGYLHTIEYGTWDNSSRPGGVLMTAEFSSSTQNTTLRLLSDKSTVVSLIHDIVADCSSFLRAPDNISVTSYNYTLPAPKPEQTVQYYRASSVALTLDGYNNTAIFGPEGTPGIPLPTNIDISLVNCLNSTIANAVPLVENKPNSSGYGPTYTHGSGTVSHLLLNFNSSTVALLCLLWCLIGRY